jgi:hypothetical protein
VEKILKILLLPLLILLFISISSCSSNKTNIANEKKIRQDSNYIISDIINNASEYEGKTVIIEGMYGGWIKKGCDLSKSAHLTRSDKIIYDSTGCIYMTGGVEYIYKETEILSPADTSSIGRKIKIRATVILKEGKPILGGEK